VLSQGQKNNTYSEQGRENLAVGSVPKPMPKPSVSPLEVAPPPDLAQLPSNSVPLHPGPSAPPAEVAVAPVPNDLPEVASAEGNLVDATAETGVDSLVGGKTEILFVMVDVEPVASQIVPGCDLALLVDVSGSVLGSGMKEAVGATADIYSQQGAANRTWLIAFGDEAQILVDGTNSVPNAGQLDKLLRTSLPAGGGTLLSPAISLALQSLRAASTDGHARHVVIVSDGELGDSEMAIHSASLGWKEDGISFSGILVGGSSGGEGVLQELARESNGQFARAQGMAGAGKLLRDQASLARSIVLRDLQLEARLAAGVVLRRAFLAGTVRELATAGTPTETLKLGDIHRGEKRRVLLELEVKQGKGRERNLAWISLLSKGADAKARPPQVLQQVRVLNGTKKPTVNPVVDKCVDAVYAAINRRR